MFSNKTSNPALGREVFGRAGLAGGEGVMTLTGTINKTIISFLILIAAAAWSWSRVGGIAEGAEASTLLMPVLAGSAIAGFITAMITIFRQKLAPYTTPVYAVFEGVFLGAVSAMAETAFDGQGIVFRAVSLTLGTFFVMLFLYRSGMIKVTNKFRFGVIGATGGIAIVYLLSWIMSLFGVGGALLYGNSMMSIGISLFVVVIAALNLVLDFDFIEKGSKAGAPAYMEWYGAFSLLVTMVWLYLEMLRLLSKIASRN